MENIKIKGLDDDLSKWSLKKLANIETGNNNKNSGLLKKISTLGGKAAGPINGKLYGSKNINKITKEQKSKGGKTSHKNHIESGWWNEYVKIGAKASTEARIGRKIEKYKSILKLIKKKQFQFSDVVEACAEFGVKDPYGYGKVLLREKSLITQIHKGYNQFNPSIYEKVKQ